MPSFKAKLRKLSQSDLNIYFLSCIVFMVVDMSEKSSWQDPSAVSETLVESHPVAPLGKITQNYARHTQPRKFESGKRKSATQQVDNLAKITLKKSQLSNSPAWPSLRLSVSSIQRRPNRRAGGVM